MHANGILCTGTFALAAVALLVQGASARQIYLPHRPGVRVDPVRSLVHVGPYAAPNVDRNPGTISGTWKDVRGTLPFSNGPWNPVQLTDGTVLVQDYCTSNWYRLTPDSKGHYANGSWSAIAAMPSGYAPFLFSSQILSDGRLIVNGGEYDGCNASWTNKGALYDPVANSWTAVTPPAGWSTIGDAQSVILPNGRYMLANCCDSPGEQAIASIRGTKVTWTIANSYDQNDEEGWTNLPGGDVLTVDVANVGSNYNDYELYNPKNGTWTLAGRTADLLSDGEGGDVGPAALTPAYGTKGSVIQFTANLSSGINDIYDVASGTWTSGPVMMAGSTIYDCADAPAATLPDGNVLVQASPGPFATPSHFWEFGFGRKGKVTATQVNDPKQAPLTTSFEGNLLVLPTGQVLWDDSQTIPNEVALYTPGGKAKAAWKPVISSVATSLTTGSTGNAISGTNFNGFDVGGTYGDDAQASTNFPLVRITNVGSGDVCFGRSYNFSTMGVWTKGTTNAMFDIPASCETGASTLQVIVNGIASAGVAVTLSS